ncbi:MAG: hypothetical protein D6765_03275 [Bacteroidetes bacterium]|nr:MAG: hypothetical protein D6765_03275 [Bacteroidota bacterium]
MVVELREPRATSHELRATSYEPRATSHEPRATSHHSPPNPNHQLYTDRKTNRKTNRKPIANPTQLFPFVSRSFPPSRPAPSLRFYDFTVSRFYRKGRVRGQIYFHLSPGISRYFPHCSMRQARKNS